MPTYTNAWNESVPLGSAARNTVDDLFRQSKLDLRERLVPLVFTNMALDPLVLNPAILGNTVGKVMNIHWSAFIPMGEFNTNWNLADAYIEDSSAGSTHLYAPLVMAPGSVITTVNFKVFPNGGGTWNVSLVRITKATGVTATIVGPLASAGTVIQTLTSGVISHTVDGASVYCLHIESPGSPARFFHADITYDVADSRVTL